MGGWPPSARPESGSTSGAAPLNTARLLADLDLDYLDNQAWQTLPPCDAETSRLDAELTARAHAAESGSAAYSVAMQALWHNCPNALEVALCAAQSEIDLMAQKLEFTRIRQQFVELCRRYRAAGSMSSESFLQASAQLEARCAALLAAQPSEQASALPGLVTRRDTGMLQCRIRDISRRLTGPRTVRPQACGHGARPSQPPQQAWPQKVCSASVAPGAWPPERVPVDDFLSWGSGKALPEAAHGSGPWGATDLLEAARRQLRAVERTAACGPAAKEPPPAAAAVRHAQATAPPGLELSPPGLGSLEDSPATASLDGEEVATSDGDSRDQNGSVTTLMIQNIPTGISRAAFLRKLNAFGFQEKYDFVHLPMIFGTGKNQGFAFVNFLSEEDAQEFQQKFSAAGCKRGGWRAVPAHLQGYEANARAASLAKTTRIRHYRYKPLVLQKPDDAASTISPDSAVP